jgi:hypothetical protein
MLYAFGFERVGVVAGDLYFKDPHPAKGQEGAEHGVRVELRVLERGALKGSIYSAQPIEVGRPIWRADLLETVDGPPAASTAPIITRCSATGTRPAGSSSVSCPPTRSAGWANAWPTWTAC